MENQESVNEWASKTFGNPTPKAAVARMLKEVEELKELDLSEVSAEEAMRECADILIVLWVVSDTLGGDLQYYVNEKMQINRKRKWKMNGDGTGQHVKE